jgi:hypothetical protein
LAKATKRREKGNMNEDDSDETDEEFEDEEEEEYADGEAVNSEDEGDGILDKDIAERGSTGFGTCSTYFATHATKYKMQIISGTQSNRD